MHPFFKWIGFPIRKSADQFIFADPRGLSQLITSFIASESQGIPRVPFLTFFYLCAFCSHGMLFDSCYVHWFTCSLVLGLATAVPLSLFAFEALTVLYTVVFSFNLLLPICQRTFTPVFLCGSPLSISIPCQVSGGLVENNGFEPLTLCVQGRCSSQLS
jgi:hypothetical protein